MKWFSALLLGTLLMASASARTDEGPDDQYIHVYRLIERADTLGKSGSVALAKAKYQEAQKALLQLKQTNPGWSPKVISYRLDYVAGKIDELSRPPAPAPVASATAEQPAAKSGAKATTPSAAPKVKLLEAGAEPRHVLRIHPKPGDKQSSTMTMKMGMDMGMGGSGMKMPTMKMPLEITVKSVSAEGNTAYEIAMGETTVEDEPGAVPQVVEAMKKSLAATKGFSITGTLSNRGFNRGTQMKAPPGVNPQLRQTVDQMKEALASSSAQFPEEAIGPGAKWEVEESLKSQGLTIDQKVTYELISVEGDRVKFKRTTVQHAANQKMSNPAMPGLKVDVAEMTGTGTGNATFDLTQLLPAEATDESHSEMTMGMNMGGQAQTMKMKMDMNIRIESK